MAAVTAMVAMMMTVAERHRESDVRTMHPNRRWAGGPSVNRRRQIDRGGRNVHRLRLDINRLGNYLLVNHRLVNDYLLHRNGLHHDRRRLIHYHRGRVNHDWGWSVNGLWFERFRDQQTGADAS